MTMTLQQHYRDKTVPELTKKFKVKNTLALPMLEKIVVNSGIGSWIQ